MPRPVIAEVTVLKPPLLSAILTSESVYRKSEGVLPNAFFAECCGSLRLW